MTLGEASILYGLAFIISACLSASIWFFIECLRKKFDL